MLKINSAKTRVKATKHEELLLLIEYFKLNGIHELHMYYGALPTVIESIKLGRTSWDFLWLSDKEIKLTEQFIKIFYED